MKYTSFPLTAINLSITEQKKPPACKDWARHPNGCTDQCVHRGNAFAFRLDKLVVVDVDIELPQDSPAWDIDTLIVKTRRGAHFYFEGSAVPTRKLHWEIKHGKTSYTVNWYGPAAEEYGYQLINDAEPMSKVTFVYRNFLKYLDEMYPQTIPVPKFGEDFVIPEGMRNDYLFRFACALVGHLDLEYEQIVAQLWEVNEKECIPPLSMNEIRSIVKSASRYEHNCLQKG